MKKVFLGLVFLFSVSLVVAQGPGEGGHGMTRYTTTCAKKKVGYQKIVNHSYATVRVYIDGQYKGILNHGYSKTYCVTAGRNTKITIESKGGYHSYNASNTWTYTQYSCKKEECTLIWNPHEKKFEFISCESESMSKSEYL